MVMEMWALYLATQCMCSEACFDCKIASWNYYMSQRSAAEGKDERNSGHHMQSSLHSG